MDKILVTGFTGNVGQEIALALKEKQAEIICAVRNVEKAKEQYGNTFNDYVRLDYSFPETFQNALREVNRIFLMFPPETKFEPFHAFIRLAKEKGLKHIVYLSVKDVQHIPIIPHYKNEKVIRDSGINYTFLRAGYFMQNLNLFLLDELKRNDRIYVPAGKGKTSFTDVRDIAEIGALALINTEKHTNKKYTITGDQALNFFEVAEMMSQELGRVISYSNPSAKEFKKYMLDKKLPASYLNVVIGLHFITKIGLAGGITHTYTHITGKKPKRLEQYLKDYQHYWN